MQHLEGSGTPVLYIGRTVLKGTVHNGLNGSELHTVVVFCEHGNEMAGFGNGAEFYKYRNYCQLHKD